MHEKCSMSLKNSLSQEEWDELQATLPRGSHVKGRVVSVHRFGVFVDIGSASPMTIPQSAMRSRLASWHIR